MAIKKATNVKPKQSTIKKPNWDLWMKRERCTIAKAVALSMNVSPRCINSLKSEHPKRYKVYLSRLESSRLAVGHTLRINADHLAGGAALDSKIVDFGVFVPFALSKGWGKECEGFKSLGKIEARAISSQENPGWKTISLPYVTKRMEAVFSVMLEYREAFESDRPPKQTAIAGAIDKQLGIEKSPSRTGQELATMIRPDHLRESDRRANARSR